MVISCVTAVIIPKVYLNGTIDILISKAGPGESWVDSGTGQGIIVQVHRIYCHYHSTNVRNSSIIQGTDREPFTGRISTET